MVVVNNVTKKFGHTEAVRRLSFRVKKGEILGLVGANGSGKTTTLKMIVGLLQPTEGRIQIDGVDRVEDPIRARRLIGYAPEAPYLYDYLSGSDYLTFVGQARGFSEAQARQTAQKLLVFFDLLEAQNDLIRNYSYGMKKKISVASAWVGSPPILILDEPTEGLDVFAVQRLSAQLKEMKAEGKTILIASHMIQFVTELTDRLVILRKGSLVKILEWSDLDSRERLAQVEKIYSPMDVAQVPPWKRSEKA